MKISVIIATYNRFEDLKRALHSLEKMDVQRELSWELIIVDNNSNDKTKDIFEEFEKKNTLPLRYFFEGHQGKAFAINTGIRNSKGDILAFTDDDAIVDKYWLTSIEKEFMNDTVVAGVGGRVELFNKKDKPVTIRTFKERILFSSTQHVYTLIIGCNMSFKKEVFKEVGGIDTNLGPGSKSGAVADDPDFIYRVYKKGFKMIYSPDVVVYHNHGRREEDEIQSINQKYVIGRGAFYCKYVLHGDIKIFMMACLEISDILKSLLKNLLEGKNVSKNRKRLCYLIAGAIYMATNFRSFKKEVKF